MRSILIIMLLSLLLISCNKKDNYTTGNEFFNNKNYKEALKSYEIALNAISEKDRDIIYRKIGISYYNVGDYKKANLSLNKSLKLDPNQEKIRIIFAKSLLKLNNYEGAIYNLKKVPDSKEKYLLLSEAYLVGDNVREGINFLKKVLDESNNKQEKSKIKYDFTLKLLKYSKFCKEKENFFLELESSLNKKEFKIDKNEFYKNFYKILQCDKKKFNDKKKIEVLNKIKNDTFYINELAELYIKNRKLPKAIDLINRSKKINPNQNKILYLEGMVYYYKGKFDSSIYLFEKFLKKEDNLKALKLLSNSLLYTKKYDEAIKSYKKVIKKDRFDLDIYLSLRECYQYTNNKEELKKIDLEIERWKRRFYK